MDRQQIWPGGGGSAKGISRNETVATPENLKPETKNPIQAQLPPPEFPPKVSATMNDNRSSLHLDLSKHTTW